MYLWEVVKVGCVVDGVDLDGDGGRALPDVRPVHALEVAQRLDIAEVLHPLLVITAKSEINPRDMFYRYSSCHNNIHVTFFVI